jgi:hypothetical protein
MKNESPDRDDAVIAWGDELNSQKKLFFYLNKC